MNEKSIGKAVTGSLLAACLLIGPNVACADEPSAIAFTGTESEFVLAGRDLFFREDNGLPGDVYTGDVNVSNMSENACDAFLRLQDVRASGPVDMLERIPCMVSVAGEARFEGFLSEAERTEPIRLGTLKPGESFPVECAVAIPAELTNEYADAAVSMDAAVLFAEEETALVPTGVSLGKTGDVPAAVPFVVGVFGAGGAVIWCAWKRRIRMW